MPKAPGHADSPQALRHAKFAVAGAVIALLVAVVAMVDFPPRFPSEPHSSIGRVLARQTSALVGKGGKVIVITRDTEAFHQPSLDALFSAFESGLRDAGIAVDSVQKLQLDPAKPMQIPAGDFFEWMRKAGPGSVIVSLLGPAFPSQEQYARLVPGAVKVVAFCPGNTPKNVDLKRLFEIGVLHAAVVDRGLTQSVAISGQGGDFDNLYLEINPSNLAKLPSSGGDAP